ncbi:MAG: hypothetical protein AAB490_05340 [Patescibacteria group bacterium]
MQHRGNSIFRESSGLGLVELLVYIGIMTIILLMTSQFAVSMIRGQQRSSEVQRVHQTVRSIVTLLNYDVRSAYAIATSTSIFGDPNGVLELIDTASSTIRYELTNGSLFRTHGAGPSVPVTINIIAVEEFQIEYLGDPEKSLQSIRLHLTMSAGFPGTNQFYQQEYTTAITRR